MENHINKERCPLCGEGNMLSHSDGTFKFKYQRRSHVITDLLYAKCDHCGTSGYLEGQLTHNKKIIEAFQKSLASFISPSEILALREKYLLTQEKAAKIFGGGIRGFSKWERGLVSPAEPTAKLMLLAFENTSVMRRLAQLENVEIDLPITYKDQVTVFIESLGFHKMVTDLESCIPDLLFSFPNDPASNKHVLLEGKTQTVGIEFDDDSNFDLHTSWLIQNEKARRPIPS